MSHGLLIQSTFIKSIWPNSLNIILSPINLANSPTPYIFYRRLYSIARPITILFSWIISLIIVV